MHPDGCEWIAPALPIDGAEIRTIKIVSGATLNPTGAAWSPDGEWIVFSGHTDPGPCPVEWWE